MKLKNKENSNQNFSYFLNSIGDYFFLKDYYSIISTPLNGEEIFNFNDSLTFLFDEILKLVNDFYQTIPEKFKSLFSEEFKKKAITLAPASNSDIIASTRVDNGKYYITLSDTKDFEQLTSLVHEYGHIINFKIKSLDTWSYEYSTILSEFSSIFMQLISLDFYMNNNKLYKGALNQMIGIYNTLLDNHNILKNKNIIGAEATGLASFSDYTNREFTKYLSSTYLFSKKDYSKYFKHPASKIMPYYLGTLLAIELYKIYLENSKEAFEIYGQMLLVEKNYPEEFFEEFKKLGIIPTASLNNFTRILKR